MATGTMSWHLKPSDAPFVPYVLLTTGVWLMGFSIGYFFSPWKGERETPA